jgi:hypothetical protein
MISFGSSKSNSKSKTESGTKFPTDFFNQAYGYFGNEPGYNPEYVGFNDFNKLESNIYGSQQAKISTAYDQAKKERAQELSLSGLLNSPSRYIEGGVEDSLNKNYMSALQQAARDASQQSLTAQQQEAGRQTAFNVDTAKTILTNFLNKLLLAAQAGRYSTGSSSGGGSGFNLGLLTFGPSSTSSDSGNTNT